MKPLFSLCVQITFSRICCELSRANAVTISTPFPAIWVAVAFCSTLEHEKPNSVNDKKGWSAHPSHTTPGAHNAQEIGLPLCYSLQVVRQKHWRVLWLYKLCCQNRVLDKSEGTGAKQMVSYHLLSTLQQGTIFCSEAYRDLTGQVTAYRDN